MAHFETIRSYIFTTTGSIGFLANLIELVLLCRDKMEITSVFRLALLSLNIADLLVSLVVLLIGVTYAVHMSIFNANNLPLYKYLVYRMSIVFSVNLSLTHILFIAIQRLIAVVFPLKVKHIMTKSRCCFILSLLWLFSVTFAAMVYFYAEMFVIIHYLTIITGVLLILMYSVICCKTMKASMASFSSEEMQRRRQKSDKEVLLYSLAITGVFIVCNFLNSMRTFFEYSFYLIVTAETLLTLNPFTDTVSYFAWSYYKRRVQAMVNDPPPVANVLARNQGPPLKSTTHL